MYQSMRDYELPQKQRQVLLVASISCRIVRFCIVKVYGYIRIILNIQVYSYHYMHNHELPQRQRQLELILDLTYGVATISRIHKIIGLFCRISSLL